MSFESRVHIVADIGGTNARFSHICLPKKELLGTETFQCAEFPSLVQLIEHYRQRYNLHAVSGVCLAVAAPVELDRVELLNNHWQFSRLELEERLGLPLQVINDFTAQVLAADAMVKENDPSLLWLGEPRPRGGQVIAAVDPGTGLGVSALLPGGEILPSEAGHMAFAPVNTRQQQLLTYLRQRASRVSYERVLSGMGLENLYWANAKSREQEAQRSAVEITTQALDGDAHCGQVIEDFFAILAQFSGDFTLATGARGGLYISGGIVPRVLSLLDTAKFRQQFEDKGRFRQYCSQVPLAIVTDTQPGLRGCVEAVLRTE